MSRQAGGETRTLWPAAVRAVRILDGALRGPDLIASLLVGLALLAITGTLFLGAVGRYALGFSLVGGEEAARYLMVWMTFLGAYLLARKRAHISIDILPRFASLPVRRWLAVSIGVLGTVVMFYLFWNGWSLAERMLAGGQFSPVLPVPRGLLHLSLPVGAALTSLAFLHMFLSGLFDPDTELLLSDPDAGVEGALAEGGETDASFGVSEAVSADNPEKDA